MFNDVCDESNALPMEGSATFATARLRLATAAPRISAARTRPARLGASVAAPTGATCSADMAALLHRDGVVSELSKPRARTPGAAWTSTGGRRLFRRLPLMGGRGDELDQRPLGFDGRDRQAVGSASAARHAGAWNG